MEPELRSLVHKRLTLNLLIQGAAGHACMTAHHLVRDDIDALHPDLMDLYDQFAVAITVQYWNPFVKLILGNPRKFWRAIHDPDHPFHRHRFLTECGAELAEGTRISAHQRQKQVCSWMQRHFPWPRIEIDSIRLMRAEKPLRGTLKDLACRAVSEIWGLDTTRMDAEIVGLMDDVEFGRLAPPRNRREKFLRFLAASYGGVERDLDGRLIVKARAHMWVMLSHELVKGVAELICMHGMNQLESDQIRDVFDAADQLQFEPSMLHSGPELWHRFLRARNPSRSLAHDLMYVARLEPRSLEALMIDVVRNPDRARVQLSQLE